MQFFSKPRIYQSSILLFLLSIFLISSIVQTAKAQSTAQPKTIRTKWEISPSFKFDTLCFLNTLTGDPFYLDYYKTEFTKFEPQLTPEVKTALANLKRKLKDEQKTIISAYLSLYFSATDDENLTDMIKTLENSEVLKANLKKTSYYNEESWEKYESVRNDLKIIFGFLKKIRFEEYWKKNILPKVKYTIAEIKPGLPKYDVIDEVEKHLGKRLSSDKITVYMLYYSQPHGIKITGTRFLTDVAWSFDILLRTSIHEMMHPPIDYRDKELLKTLRTFNKDSFLMDKVLNHNPAFGYNSFEGYMEENIIKAVDQIISEKLNVAHDAKKRFKENDDGMHVFAAALYDVMKKEGFPEKGETLRDFLLRIVRTGKLSPGDVKTAYDVFYKEKESTQSEK